MPPDPCDADWLEEVRELNRLFLTYVRARAEAGGSCLGLPRRVARSVAQATPAALDRLADLPTALFRLDIESSPAARDGDRPDARLEQMHESLALTILSSAWHMARSRPFEARAFLHLSHRALEHLRQTPLSQLPALARGDGVLQCAFTEARLTWSALIDAERPDPSRMLILIALQPDLVSAPAASSAEPSFGSVC